MHCGNAIWPHNEEGLENLARYIIRASFSQERMTYIAIDDSTDGMAKVLYESKNGKATKTFDALDWPALLNEWNIRIPSLVSTHWSQQLPHVEVTYLTG